VLGLSLYASAAAAQSPSAEWTPPQPLVNACCAAHPIPVIDPWGRLHLLWADAEGYIWYSRLGDDGWTPPVDVVGNPGNNPASGLDAAVDAAGRLHLIWRDGNTGAPLYYSSVDVRQADNARAWSVPFEVAPVALGAAIALAPAGRIHVVYTPFEEGVSFAHITSDDGVAWTAPSLAPGRLSTRFTGGPHIELAIDGAGTLHVVWNSQAYPAGYPEHAVFYQRSADGGQSWSEPYDPDPLPPEVDADAESAFKNKLINVAIGPRGDVHLTWHQYTGYRFHRWSEDGGLTWRESESIFPDMGPAFNGVVDMAFDSSGAMHVVAARNSIWYRTWNPDGQWAPPVLVDPNPADWHHQRIAVVGGNEVYLFYPDINETGLLWFTHKRAAAPAIATVPPPELLDAVTAAQPVANVSPTVTLAPSIAVTATALPAVLRLAAPDAPNVGRWLWALAPALALSVAAVVWRLFLARRR
jgi:hypothetical protein